MPKTVMLWQIFPDNDSHDNVQLLIGDRNAISLDQSPSLYLPCTFAWFHNNYWSLFSSVEQVVEVELLPESQ